MNAEKAGAKHRALVKAFGTTGEWFTLEAMTEKVGGGQTAVSARIRELRRPEHGGHSVEVRRMPTTGRYFYRINPASALVTQRMAHELDEALDIEARNVAASQMFAEGVANG